MATLGLSTESGAAHSVLWDASGARATGAALLEWMKASSLFADEQHVFVYVVDDGEVTMSLVDRTAETVSEARVTEVDAKSAEKFGATVPIAWDVLDHAGVEADLVALFANPADETLIMPILELGLGKPVVRIDSYVESIAHGAALVAARSDPQAGPTQPVPAAVIDTAPVAAPIASATASWMHSRRNLVLAGVVLLGVLSGGVALAATLPGSAPAPVADVSVPALGPVPPAGATAVPSAAVAAPAVAPAPAQPPVQPPVQPPAAPVPAVRAAASVAKAPEAKTAPAAVAPQPAVAPVPAPPPTSAGEADPTTIDPPAFAIPPIVPDPSDPSKSQAELQQEAWDRHWLHTEQWIGQELGVGN